MPQFSFLPYFPSDDIDLKVNRLHLFNFWNHKDTYIPDADVKQYLERICSMYVDSKLDRLKELTVAVIDDNYALNPTTEEQLLDTERYANALSFCSIVTNEDNNISSSDNYVMFHQPFQINEESIAYATGSYLRLDNWQPLDTTKLVKPSYIQKPILRYQFDELLFKAFANMIDAHNKDDDYLFRVLEWFKYSYMNVEGFSYHNRIVLLATAYEIFFDLPEFGGKADAFATGLETLLEVNQWGLQVIRKPNSLGRQKENTVYGWWTREFYDLRSKIVHGSELTQADATNHRGADYFRTGIKMLEFSFYKLLENKGYLVYPAPAPEVRAALPNFNYAKHRKQADLREIENSI
jgi:hypothetical protein